MVIDKPRRLHLLLRMLLELVENNEDNVGLGLIETSTERSILKIKKEKAAGTYVAPMSRTFLNQDSSFLSWPLFNRY